MSSNAQQAIDRFLADDDQPHLRYYEVDGQMIKVTRSTVYRAYAANGELQAEVEDQPVLRDPWRSELITKRKQDANRDDNTTAKR